jgi:hypothetical protein
MVEISHVPIGPAQQIVANQRTTKQASSSSTDHGGGKRADIGLKDQFIDLSQQEIISAFCLLRANARALP